MWCAQRLTHAHKTPGGADTMNKLTTLSYGKKVLVMWIGILTGISLSVGIVHVLLLLMHLILGS